MPCPTRVNTVSNNNVTPSTGRELNETQLRALVEAQLPFTVHLWQLHIACVLLEKQKKVVISTAATGAGKSITFFLPLLAGEDGITFIIVPLTVLGEQMVETAKSYGITAFNASSESLRDKKEMEVQCSCQLHSSGVYLLSQELAQGSFRVIAISPELLLDPRFWKLYQTPLFRRRISRIILDEAHCATLWGESFRAKYLELGRLYLYLAHHASWVQWYLTSATLTLKAASKVLETLSMPVLSLQSSTHHSHPTQLIQRSNDRPNLHYAVKRMKYPASSYKDLAALLCPHFIQQGGVVPQTIIYTESRKEAENIEHYLRVTAAENHRRGEVSFDYSERIVYVHAGMSDLHRQEAAVGFANETINIVIATEALGLGIDIRNVAVVVQYGIVTSIDTFAQRSGRGGRVKTMPGLSIWYVPGKYFADEQAKKAKAAAASAKRRKTNSGNTPLSNPPIEDPPPAPEVLDDNNGEEYVPVLEPDQDHNTLNAPASVQLETLPDTQITSRGLKRKRASAKDSVSPEVNAFINADQLGEDDERKGCRRKVLHKHYGLKHIRVPRNCCPHCTLLDPTEGCCDLCTPSIVKEIFSGAPSLPNSKQPRAAKLDPFDYSKDDTKLRSRLTRFRSKRVHDLLPQGMALSESLLTPQCFMSDTLLQQIVSLAHHGKLVTKGDLISNLKWGWRHRYADAILKLVHRSHPLPPPPPPPSAASSIPSRTQANIDPVADEERASGSATTLVTPVAPAAPKRLYRCSYCKQTGHYMSSCSTSYSAPSCEEMLTKTPESPGAPPAKPRAPRQSKASVATETGNTPIAGHDGELVDTQVCTIQNTFFVIFSLCNRIYASSSALDVFHSACN
ncbi:P-loop containing nucleoside triphosphate hydrolase protein [Clavulina sp. PMI_390]|nr:P-loop containing nucleoside triphosphate hydrolase protein [Clavulina sp. PMI_390]